LKPHDPSNPLLRDSRVQRLLIANTLGSIGSGVTIFAVPWLLVHLPDGNAAYRSITIITTLALFAMMPAYGAWVDRHSRKTALLTSEAFGFIATTSMAVLGLWRGVFPPWQLMAIYFCGMMYYTLHYPAKFAFVQQIFDRSQYQALTGLMEVQGQTAMMIAGGIGGWMTEHAPLWVILLIDASTYAISFVLMATLHYEPTHLKEIHAAPPGGMVGQLWHNIVTGWNWLRERPRIAWFLTCSLMPFIVVMVGNYLFPIYVAKTLHAGATIFGAGEVVFAVGAVIAGLFLPRLLARTSADVTIPATMIVFTLGLVVLLTLRHSALYLTAALLLGFGNAGSRVARSALMLHLVPNALMGRVTVFYHLLDRLLRTVLVAAMAIIDLYGPPSGFAVLLGLMVLAIWGALATRRSLRGTENETSSMAAPLAASQT